MEARIKALKEEEQRSKVADVHALADGKAVGKTKAGEAEVHATRMPSRRTRDLGRIPVSPEVNKMIEDEVGKRLQERMIKSEPRTEARRQLTFDEADQDDDSRKPMQKRWER